jgi:ribosomal protein S18 acetylase RimI-like enzyme
MDIFNQSKSLLQDVFYTDVRRTPTFTYLKSVFSDKYYNLLEPTVPPKQMDWYSAYKILDEEKRAGVEVSYYIRHDLYAEYKPYLMKKGYALAWDDIYVRKNLDIHTPLPEGQFNEVDIDSLEHLIRLSNECFPDYPNGKEYCQMCLAVTQQHAASDDKKNLNILMKKNGEEVSFGSILLSRKQKLGYIHNVGTVERFRRQGLFSSLVHYLEHQAVQEGIEVVYANVENHGSSYHGFLKLGYQINCQYHLFCL